MNHEPPADPSEGAASEALLGYDLIDFTGATIAERFPQSSCAIVTDTIVGLLFGDRVRQSLASAGFQPTVITIPAGEQSKTLEQAGGICDQMLEAGLDRSSFVVGLGGGVIGDISGFVAAIFERGVPHVQIPTTLLAMVDSSIGGKTAVDTRSGKNLIGAFHQPVLVIDDVDVLKTLPRRELNQGFAEIIKHAIIADAGMFSALQDASKQMAEIGRTPDRRLEFEDLLPLIQRNIEIKSGIVAGDKFDRAGERALLNFGHTVGHAIERAGDYQHFLHGEAVSLGMAAACAISIRKAGLSEDERNAITELLHSFDLPTQLPEHFPRQKIFDALPFDKKFSGGQIRFVLTPQIGSAGLSDEVTMDDIYEAVAEL